MIVAARIRSLALLAAALTALGSVAQAHPDLDVLEHEAARELAQRPADPALNLQQAQVYRVAHAWDAALGALDHAAAHGADPDEVGALRGQILLEAERPDAAWVELDRVVARRPEALPVLYDRGRAALALGRQEDAARDFAAALTGMPQPRPEQVFVRRDLLLALGRRAEAIRALDDGIAKLGPAASLHLAALDIEVELRRWDAALRRLDLLIALEPRNETWLVRRGDLLAAAGRPADARTAWADALAAIEKRPPGHRGRKLAALENRLRTTLAATAKDDLEGR